MKRRLKVRWFVEFLLWRAAAEIAILRKKAGATMSAKKAQNIRAAVRAVVVAATAFGLGLTAEQVAAVYGVTEAFLQLLVKGSDSTY